MGVGHANMNPHVNMNTVYNSLPIGKNEEPTDFFKIKNKGNLNLVGTLVLSAQSAGGTYVHYCRRVKFLKNKKYFYFIFCVNLF